MQVDEHRNLLKQLQKTRNADLPEKTDLPDLKNGGARSSKDFGFNLKRCSSSFPSSSLGTHKFQKLQLPLRKM
jgi:hypothetical protein